MKRNNLTIVLGVVIILSTLIFTSCEEEYPDPLWPGDNPDGGPAPTITSVTPSDTAWTDADTVIIVGTNSSDDIGSMHVAFGGVRGQIVASTTTQLSILPPTNFKDSLTIKIDRSGENGTLTFAEYYPYFLKNPFSKPGDPIFAEVDMIYGIAADNEGNVFLSSAILNASDVSSKKIIKLLPNGDRIDDWSKTATNKGVAMRMGPNGNLFYMNYNAGGWISKTDTLTGGTDYGQLGTATFDLDFDSNGNLFYVGEDAIYKVDPSDLSVSELAMDYTDYKLKAARVYNGNLYVGSVYIGTDTLLTGQKIWKHSIASDGSLGSQQEVVDWTSKYSSIISALEFDEYGNMFVGTVSTADIESDGIIKISASGIHSYFYPQLLRGDITYSVYKMTWTGNYMYCSIRDGADASNNTIIKLNMFSKSAEYHER